VNRSQCRHVRDSIRGVIERVYMRNVGGRAGEKEAIVSIDF
jgi:hypothetical protein